jgi:predicted RecA/RadA family phage recombinase
MADISRNVYVRWHGEEAFARWVLDNSAAQEIYIGSPMWLDISEDTVYPRTYLAASTPATGDVFVGFALEPKSVATADTETDNEIKISEPGSIVGLPAAALTDADVGKAIYMSDSGVVDLTSAGAIQVGVLRRVVDGYAFIKTDYYITA